MSPTGRVLPKSLAIVDDDREYAQFLAVHLQARGVVADVFSTSNLLLAHPGAYAFDFYVVDLMLPGIAGLDLIQVLRLRTDAGILVVSGRLAPDVLDDVLTAGADMFVAKPATLAQVTLAVSAVHRRVSRLAHPTLAWRLDARARRLIAPDGASIDLSDADLDVLECFVDARGEVVPREALAKRLGLHNDVESTGGVYAAIYRLRRRIERGTTANVPLQSVSRVGYCFKAPLECV